MKGQRCSVIVLRFACTIFNQDMFFGLTSFSIDAFYKGGGGGGGSPCFFVVKLDFKIAVDQQTKA